MTILSRFRSETNFYIEKYLKGGVSRDQLLPLCSCRTRSLVQHEIFIKFYADEIILSNLNPILSEIFNKMIPNALLYHRFWLASIQLNIIWKLSSFKLLILSKNSPQAAILSAFDENLLLISISSKDSVIGFTVDVSWIQDFNKSFLDMENTDHSRCYKKPSKTFSFN